MVHPRRSIREFAYVTAALPLATFWTSVLLTVLATGLGLSIILVGLPLLGFGLWLTRWGAWLERERAGVLLEAPIARSERPLPGLGWRWLKAIVRDPATWRDLGWFGLLLVVGVPAAAVVIALWSCTLAALAVPVAALTVPGGSFLGDADVLVIVALTACAVPLGAAALVAQGLIARGEIALAQRLLGPDPTSELTERVSTLEQTRAGAVESSDATLRRIERDLHDGAQHRLAYIAMELGRAQEKLDADPEGARDLLAGAHEESKRAMVELRDLVRGIHPSVLTDRGLDAAVSGLAARAPVPVAVRSELAARPPAAVERAAYFVVAEALQNVARHAGATRADVSLSGDAGRLVVEVRDDGRGGAARRPGSGLEGLAQRLEALDGTLTVQSPDGGPTLVRAELPCAS